MHKVALKCVGKKKMSHLLIDCIADTHNTHHKVNLPGGNILIHAGDSTLSGKIQEAIPFLDWFMDQNYQYRVLIPGNHDFIYERNFSLMEEECKKRNIILLNDSGIHLEGIPIWGSPITPWFYDWAFNRERGKEIKVHWDLIPKETEILVTHGPPYGILDEVKTEWGIKSQGCEELLKKINQTEIKLHVFGHIHEGQGHLFQNERLFVNASSVNEKYKPYPQRYQRIIRENGKFRSQESVARSQEKK
jgi:Icc-related predicted phosphoesterase